MAQRYSTNQYLLDRADIEDVVKLMYMHLDHKNFEALGAEVFAEDIHVDYSSLLGIEPYNTTGSKQAETWKEQIKSFPRTLHFVGVISHLPRPGANAPPKSTTAVANGVVALVHTSRFINQNRGRLYLDLIRTESTTANPWRISGLRIEAVCVTYETDRTGEPMVPADVLESSGE